VRDRLIPQMPQMSKMLKKKKDPPDLESKNKREYKSTRLTAIQETKQKFSRLLPLDYSELEDTETLS
jgi:hypothetical protein